MRRDRRRLTALLPAVPLGAALLLGCTEPAADRSASPAEQPTTTRLEMSVPAAQPRFHAHGDGTAADTTTGLVWEIKGEGVGCGHCVEDRYSWSETGTEPDGTVFTVFLETLNARCDGDEQTRCTRNEQCVGIGNGLCGHAGHRDWRLPMEFELQALLLEPFECSISPCIDPSFPGPVKPSAYWASTSSTPDTARGVFFNNGFVGSGSKQGLAYTRAVRNPAGDPD